MHGQQPLESCPLILSQRTTTQQQRLTEDTSSQDGGQRLSVHLDAVLPHQLVQRSLRVLLQLRKLHRAIRRSRRLGVRPRLVQRQHCIVVTVATVVIATFSPVAKGRRRTAAASASLACRNLLSLGASPRLVIVKVSPTHRFAKQLDGRAFTDAGAGR